jgi:membrane protease YdiL (CAAX protease family)
MGSDRGTPSRLALALAVGLTLVLPSAIAWLGFFTLAGSGQPSAWQQLAYGAGKVVQFGFPVAFLLLVERRRPAFPSHPWAGVGLGLLFGLLVAGAMVSLYFLVLRDSPLLVDTPAQARQKMRELSVDSPGRFLALAVFLSALHSGMEEYYWRWFVFGRLRLLIGHPAAILVSGLGFMAHHVILLAVYLPGRFWLGVVPMSLAIASGGWVWAWLYDRSGSLLGPWVSHALVDAAIFVVAWDLVRR